jgi:hypothetical protein
MRLACNDGCVGFRAVVFAVVFAALVAAASCQQQVFGYSSRLLH